MSLEIRKAKAEDALDFVTVYNKSFQTAFEGILTEEYLNKMNVKDRVQRFPDILKKNPFTYLVIFSGKTIGILTFNPCRDQGMQEYGDINTMLLISECRGKGYGSQMMKYAINELQNIGYEKFCLWVFEKNYSARKFYEKCGFKFDGTKRNFTIGGQVVISIRYVLNVKC